MGAVDDVKQSTGANSTDTTNTPDGGSAEFARALQNNESAKAPEEQAAVEKELVSTVKGSASLTVNGAAMVRSTEGETNIQAVQNQAYPNRLVISAGAESGNVYVGGIFLADMRPDNISSANGAKISDSIRLFDARGWIGLQNEDGSLSGDIGYGASTMPSWDLQGLLLKDAHRSSLLSPQNTDIALGGTPIGETRTVGELMQTSDGGFDNGMVLQGHLGEKGGASLDAKVLGMYEVTSINEDGTAELTRKSELIVDGRVLATIPLDDFELKAAVHGGYTAQDLSGDDTVDTTTARVGAGALLRHMDAGAWALLTSGYYTSEQTTGDMDTSVEDNVFNFQLRTGVDLDLLPVGPTRLAAGYGQFDHDDGKLHTANLSVEQDVKLGDNLNLTPYAGLQQSMWKPGDGEEADANQTTAVAGIKVTGSLSGEKSNE